MLQETLSAMKKSLEKLNNENKLVTCNEINSLINHIKSWEKGKLIFPMKLVEELNISINTTYDILTQLEDDRFVEPIFQIYCYNCDSFQKEFYFTLFDISDDELCEFCHESIDINKNIIVRYRIIKD